MPQCSPEDHSRSLLKPPPVTCLGTGSSIGITITGEAGLLSLLAILYVLVVILRNVRKRYLLIGSLQIFHKPMDVLMASLLLADFIQGIGAVLSLKWVRDGKVETGNFCDAQGIIKIFGATGVALSTLAIGIFTFLGIWVHADPSMNFTVYIVATLWTFIGVLVTVAMTVNRNTEFSFMGPTPYWCWVDAGLGWKMLLEYIWLWLTLALSLLIYISLYLWMRGNLIIPAADAAWWRFRFTFSRDLNPRASGRLVMLAYPVVYCLCIIPLSAVRWTVFVQDEGSVPPAATFAAVSIFGLSGFFNAILLMKTRPSTALFDHLIFQPMGPPVLQVEQPDGPEPEPEPEPAMREYGRPPPDRVALG